MVPGKFFILMAIIGFSGCSPTKEPVKNSSEESSGEYTYLALGDSYTIGESVAVSERWPVVLVEALNSKGFDVASPKIIAKTGWTTQDLLQAMNQNLDDKKFDLISVLIGVNNQYQGKSISAYESDLKTIFEKAINKSSQGKDGVFVVSIPNYGVTPFGAENSEEIGKEIAKFNAVLKKTAEAYDLPFYNITPISERASGDLSLVANDGLHPSGKMYELWVEEIIDEVAALLED